MTTTTIRLAGFALLALAGCSLNPSLIGDKAVNRFASIVREAVKETPAPFIDVHAPAPEKIIDWPEVAAVLGMMAGGIAHRYWYHRHANNRESKIKQVNGE